MGYADRDYMNSGSGPFGSQGGRMRRPPIFENAPVSKFLVMSSVVIYLIEILMTPPNMGLFYETVLSKWGNFSINEGLLNFQIWRVLTFQFLHADFMHLLFNMVAIVFFGPHVERRMTSKTFSYYYFFCGIAGALFYSLLYFVPGLFTGQPIDRGMVGASAGIFGILAAFYKMAPEARVLLFFFIPMKIKTAAVLFFLMEIVHVLFGFSNAGGSAGHLGGALLGLTFINFKPFRSFLLKISRPGFERPQSKKVKPAEIVRESNRSPLEVTKEVDRILEKISSEGMQSLTRAERETLENARRN
ncbi:MAG: rhomboid family intramembrane serine protease [Akkermansiaceae bacterium]